MRTTLAIDDTVYSQVTEFARARSISTGEAVTELLRRALAMRTPTRVVNGLVVFDLPADSPAVDSERVRELDSEP